eukprot:1142252-Pelagomonas_calceolata.AAC.2
MKVTVCAVCMGLEECAGMGTVGRAMLGESVGAQQLRAVRLQEWKQFPESGMYVLAGAIGVPYLARGEKCREAFLIDSSQLSAKACQAVHCTAGDGMKHLVRKESLMYLNSYEIGGFAASQW